MTKTVTIQGLSVQVDVDADTKPKAVFAVRVLLGRINDHLQRYFPDNCPQIFGVDDISAKDCEVRKTGDSE